MSERLPGVTRGRRPRRHGRLRPLTLVLCGLLGASGCVTVYQPQRAIHRPVVIERAATNFAGLRVLVRCNAHKEFLPVSKASLLCGKLAQDLEQQGATTEWVVPYGASFVEPPAFEGAGADLTIEIESKIEHQYAYPLAVCLSCYTCTTLPTIEEQTFSQRVVVIGRDRSVLAEELFRERFVQYGGWGVWSLNYLLDWLVRDESQALSGDAGKKDFTRDFYGQIRQLAFNARVRGEILGLINTPKRAVDEAGDGADDGAGAEAGDVAAPDVVPAGPAAPADPADPPAPVAPAPPAGPTDPADQTGSLAPRPDERRSGYEGRVANARAEDPAAARAPAPERGRVWY